MPHDQLVPLAIQGQSAGDLDAGRRLLGLACRLGIVCELALYVFASSSQRLHSPSVAALLSLGNLLVEACEFGLQLCGLMLTVWLTFRRGWSGYNLQTADRAVAMQATIVEFEFVTKVVLLGLKILHAKQLPIEILKSRELREVSAHGARLWLRHLCTWVL
jgi:hypothetical protein